MNRLDLIIKLSTIFALIVITLSVVFYFVYLPVNQQNRNNECVEILKGKGSNLDTSDEIKLFWDVCKETPKYK